MLKFRHKYERFEVEAAQWCGPSIADVDYWERFETWLHTKQHKMQDIKYHGGLIVIYEPDLRTLTAQPGDWLVTDRNGIYPIPNVAFQKIYERITDAQTR